MASAATSVAANGANGTGSLSERVPTYHKVADAQYTLPNDAPEHIRLETQAAHLSALMNNKVVHAPIPQTATRLLDVGCGTGIVTDLLARTFPAATAYGIDLSPVPALHSRPPNVRFIQGNILKAPESDSTDDFDGQLAQTGAALPSNAFDYIYSRLLLCGMSDWPRYLRSTYRLLKAGGWAEMHDLDWAWYDGSGKLISNDWEWLQVMKEAGEARGLDFECGSRVKGRMEEAGFVEVERYEYSWPYGGEWEARPEMQAFGEYVATAMPELFHHAIPKMLEGRGYTDEQVDRWRQQMRHDFRREKGKHWIFYVTVGRKPE
ncbi:S-adenosyl-L-methionine-dependent methyltransferase [Saccharata proteae CBS 121410]|uniref:S-adenosyl-L-methionine-dependent methyltransferase n=1 Tax=Saccharata proteae CBS 121410 TaxID=1314787 RepID=A0A9P4HSL4_9PEZI|nr:S-adenosyl-L-methionine-dependent methyltransferase [Saccharata proteae CBS 121410]